MVIDDFKKLVSDYMNRDSALFDSNKAGQVDKLLLAANNAKAYAQRRLVFELSKTVVDIVVDKSTGGLISSAVLHADGVTPVLVQTFERAFLPTSDGVSLIPVDLVNRDSQVKAIKRRVENVHDPRGTMVPGSMSFMQVVRFGDRMFVQNWDSALYTTQTIKASFDVVRWMPKYGQSIVGTTTGSVAQKLVDSGATFITKGVAIGDKVTNGGTHASSLVDAVESETTLHLVVDLFGSAQAYSVGTSVQEDFFLVDCVDFMLYRTIQELNLFLKEDQRVAISAGMMKDAWDSVVSWNARLERSGEDLDLE